MYLLSVGLALIVTDISKTNTEQREDITEVITFKEIFNKAITNV